MKAKADKEKCVFHLRTTRLSNKRKSGHLEMINKLLTEDETHCDQLNPTKRLKTNITTPIKSAATLI